MATIGSLVVNLIANTTQFAAGMKKGIADTKAFESRLSAVSKMASRVAGSLGVVGGVAGAGVFLKGAIEEAAEAEAVMKKLETVVKSTGGAAGLSAVEISDFAAQLQKTTAFADDTTKSAAAVLATFTNIKGDIFKGAIVAAQDLNTALGGDLQANVIQIGKALNDPIKGVSALTKVGVSFTQQQKDQIKALTENGQAMKAQKLILAELTKEFGGQAAAAIETTTGKIEQLKNKWADLKELAGEKVALPAVDGILKTTDALGELESKKGFFGGLSDIIGSFAAGPMDSGQTMARLAGKDAAARAKAAEAIARKGITSGGALSKGTFDALYSRREPLEGKELKAFTKQLSNLYGALFIGKNRANIFGDGPSTFDLARKAKQKANVGKFGDLLGDLYGSQLIGPNRAKVFDAAKFNKFLGPVKPDSPSTNYEGRTKKYWELQSKRFQTRMVGEFFGGGDATKTTGRLMAKVGEMNWRNGVAGKIKTYPTGIGADAMSRAQLALSKSILVKNLAATSRVPEKQLSVQQQQLTVLQQIKSQGGDTVVSLGGGG